MSLETWKRDCNIIDASAEHTDLEGLKQALSKFKGARFDTRRRHRLELVFSANGLGQRLIYLRDINGVSYFFGRDGCSLCQKKRLCGECPLKSCDEDSPYLQFLTTGDPEPMIARLAQLIAEEEERIARDQESERQELYAKVKKRFLASKRQIEEELLREYADSTEQKESGQVHTCNTSPQCKHEGCPIFHPITGLPIYNGRPFPCLYGKTFGMVKHVEATPEVKGK